MAVLEENLLAYLLTQSSLTALVSTRIYPEVFPQGATKPCITYERIASTPEPTHDSSVGSELSGARFQFDIWATTRASCKAVQDKLRTALHAKRTVTGAQAVLLLDERIMYEPDTELRHGISEYRIWNID